MHEDVRVSYQRSAEEFLAPYIARISELETELRVTNDVYADEREERGMYQARCVELEKQLAEVAMPEPSASPHHEFVFGSVQSMRIRVWNETSRAVCIVDFDGVVNPAGYISAFVAGLSPLGNIPEARRAEEPKHEPDPVGSVKRYLDDGGKWD